MPFFTTPDGSFKARIKSSEPLLRATAHRASYVEESFTAPQIPDHRLVELNTTNTRFTSCGGALCFVPGNPHDQEIVSRDAKGNAFPDNKVYNELRRVSLHQIPEEGTATDLFYASSTYMIFRRTYPYDTDELTWHIDEALPQATTTAGFSKRGDIDGNLDINMTDYNLLKLYVDDAGCTSTKCGTRCVLKRDQAGECSVEDANCNNAMCVIKSVADGTTVYSPWSDLDANKNGVIEASEAVSSGNPTWLEGCTVATCSEKCYMKDMPEAGNDICASEDSSCNDKCMRDASGKILSWKSIPDINDDGAGTGNVTKEDLEKLLTLISSYTANMNSDVNKDGKVTMKDLLLIKLFYSKSDDNSVVIYDNGATTSATTSVNITQVCGYWEKEILTYCDPTKATETASYGPLDPSMGYNACAESCGLKKINSETGTLADAFIRFQDADLNKDGKVTVKDLLEIKKYYSKNTLAARFNPGFKKADYNQDGHVDWVEVNSAIDRGVDRCRDLQDDTPSTCFVCNDSGNERTDCLLND